MVGQDGLGPAHQPAAQGLSQLLWRADVTGDNQQFVTGLTRRSARRIALQGSTDFYTSGSAGQMNPPGFVYPGQRNPRRWERSLGRLLPQRRQSAGLDPVTMFGYKGTDGRPGRTRWHDHLDPPRPMHAHRQAPRAAALAHDPGLRISVGPKEKLVQFTP